MFWEKYSAEKIKTLVFQGLSQNVNYRASTPMGFPGSFLDPEVFDESASFLKGAPYLSTLMSNPNHIGCHTLGTSEEAYHGTQAIEKEVIAICASQIFKAKQGEFDGYIASGGTEANVEAFWIMRNYFVAMHEASLHEIALVYSSDSHYSMPKGANLLGLKSITVPVDEQTRMIQLDRLQTLLLSAKKEGVKHLIVVMNMGTTMFGSIDPMELVCNLIDGIDINYLVHIDAAYGGFIYPFAANDPSFSFENEKVLSISIDAHKLLQAPYGTGIFLVRKGFVAYAITEQANYVKGKDYTLIGSRSGANAVAIWMILRSYGSVGWNQRVSKLIKRTDWFCGQLELLGVNYFRQPCMNIVTILASKMSENTMKKYFLVPDNHDNPNFWKIVIMDHVDEDILKSFLSELDRFTK